MWHVLFLRILVREPESWLGWILIWGTDSREREGIIIL